MADTNTPVKKPKKAKGPIRWGAVVPFTVFTLLFVLYMHFFFDGHLRLLAQWGLTQGLGSQVDIARIETSFFNAHMRIKGIEITDAEFPNRNSVSVGEIRYGMGWDALLRAKILVNEAVIEQIEFGKPRKSPGWVKPPEPPPVDDGKPSLAQQEAEKVKNMALEKVESDYQGNVFGDLAAILGGTDANVQLDKLKESLPSKKMAETLDAGIKAKQKAWEERLKTLPKGQDFDQLGARMKAVKTKDFKSPQELEHSLKELDTIFKEADQKIKTVQAAGDDLNKDLKQINDDVKALEAQIKTDIKTLETHFKIPRIDAKALTLAVFKKYLDPYLRRFQTYRALAEKYIPPNVMNRAGNEPDPSLQPRPRSKGVSYEFGRPNSYPLVWVKRTAVSSQAGASQYSGNIKGEILDITTNQVLTGKPTIARLAGDFPAAQVNGFSTQLTVDNRKAESLIELLFGVKSYGLEGRQLVDSSDVKIGFKKAVGSVDVKASLKALRQFQLNMNNAFSGVEYDISAKNQIVDELLKKLFAGVPTVTIDGELAGVFPRINMNVNSNLGPELQKGFEREVNAKIAEARAKIDKYVQEQVGKTKAQIDAEIAKLRSQTDGEIKKLQAQAEAQKKQAQERADQAKKDAESSAKKGVEKEVKKAAEDLKKKLGW